MNTILERLEQVLKAELDTHSALVVTARAFNQALKEENIESIQQHRAAHDEALCKIEKLEEQRIECCSVLAQSFGFSKKQLKLAQLLDKIPEAWRARLSAVRQALKSKITELSKLTISNRILLEEGLRIIEHTFSLVQQGSNKYAGYGKRGQSMVGPPLDSLINRTA